MEGIGVGMSECCEEVVNAGEPERSRPNLTAFIVCLGCVVVLLDISIVNVALKPIASGLGGRLSDLQWIVDAYTVAFASFLLSAGTAGDRFGNKRVFVVGFFVFTIASVVCGAASSLPALIGARLLQGMGAALIIPCSLTFSCFLSSRTGNPNQCCPWSFFDRRNSLSRPCSAFSSVSPSAGVAVLGSLLTGAPTFVAGFQWGMIISSIIYLIGTILTLRFVPNDPHLRIDAGGSDAEII